MNDKQTEWTKRKTDKVMDRLAEEILATFAELGFDEGYIQDQRNVLVGKNRFEVLVWCNNNLDSRCKAVLADKQGINIEDLNKAISIIVFFDEL
ncbi:MAG TPA: hypothetical protein VIE65_04035 [Methylobacter sp.]|jgi:hypothetical protein